MKTSFLVWAVVALGISAPAQAQDSGRPAWRVDLAAYPYQRVIGNDTDFTATINGRLPGRFSYFSYTNFKGLLTSGSAFADRSEQNLRFALSENSPFDLAVQGIFVRGDGNDFVQAGLSWRVHDTPGLSGFFDRINFVWRVTALPVRWGAKDSAADAWELKNFFRLTVPEVSDRMYLSGFYNKTFNEDVADFVPSRPVVSEVQFGIRTWDNIYLIAEYRVNERRDGKNHNLAAGLEYKLRFR